MALQAPAGGDITLSANHGSIGSTLTINGSGFGATQGTSKVFFGEPQNPLGFRPATCEAASYIAGQWSDARIQVTVPAMSPGKTGYPHTYHSVRVNVGGTDLCALDFFIDPVTTVTSQSYSSSNTTDGNTLPATQNVLYDTCTWTDAANIAGGTGGVLQLNNNNCYVTFLNCTWTSNTGTGSGDGVNGVKVLDWGDTTHDVTFADCTWPVFSRMGIEIVGNVPHATPVLQNYGIRGCTFEPTTGGEPISFSTWASDDSTSHAVNSLIEDCTIKGWGNTSGTVYYGGAIECNGSHNVEIRNTNIWAGNAPAFNLGHQSGGNNGIYAKNVSVDFTHLYQATHAGMFAQILTADYMTGSRWDGCTFNCGNAGNHAAYGIALDTGVSNDFSRSTITGTVGVNYLDSNGTTGTLNHSPSTGNTAPTVV